MRIIKGRTIVEDSLVHVPDGTDLPAVGDITVGVDRYRELRGTLASRAGRVGVLLRPGQEAKLIADLVPELSLIAIEFPAFKDGRGYTTARLLRERFGFRGELRAVGDVLRDQLFFMERCGFTAFELKAGKDIEGALKAFEEFSVTYQGAADDPRPMFRRRARG